MSYYILSDVLSGVVSGVLSGVLSCASQIGISNAIAFYLLPMQFSTYKIITFAVTKLLLGF